MRRSTVTGCACLLSSLLLSTSAWAIDPVDSSRLEAEVSPAKIKAHLQRLQDIADRSNGTRSAGTRGYAASVAYVKNTLTAAGYRVSIEPFDFNLFTETAAPVMVRAAPGRTVYGPGTDFFTMEYSAAGSVYARVALAGGIQIPPGEPGSSTSGCSAEDFGPEVKGRIVLIQRGTCTFEEKVAFAAAAGARAAVIFNEGQPGRREALSGTLGNPAAIPAVGASYEVGKYLVTKIRAGATKSLRIKVTATIENFETMNVLADLPGKRDDRVVVVGAHLDSVAEGPGINDNGSGTAANLATAVGMKKLGVKPENTVRFAFWGAEESGLVGSTRYVEGLSEAELAKIMANLNFDMLGSPNYARLVYDGDGTLGEEGPAGSDVIEGIFEDYFETKGLASEPTEFDGRSDYFAFIENDIPAGGLFSGAEEVKTKAQVALYGGTAGEAFDACYHKACDDEKNINDTALLELGGAAANAVLTLALSKDDIRSDAKGRVAAAAAASALEYRGPHLVK